MDIQSSLLTSQVLLAWRSHVFVAAPTLETERLILRMATPNDAPAILTYYQENHAFLTTVEPTRSPGFYTLEFWQEQVEKAMLEFNYEQSLKLCLFDRSQPTRLIGKANVHQMVRGVSQSCVLGYSLAEREQGKGYMGEALQTVIHWLFVQQNFHRITANYMPRNQRSGNLLRRLGFVVEGYARDYLMINGKWEDHILTSLTNPQWRNPEFGE